MFLGRGMIMLCRRGRFVEVDEGLVNCLEVFSVCYVWVIWWHSGELDTMS